MGTSRRRRETKVEDSERKTVMEAGEKPNKVLNTPHWWKTFC